MSIDLGRIGIWQRAANTDPDVAGKIEDLGFPTLWVGGSPGGQLTEIEGLLEATGSLVVATGIVNMWRDDAGTLAVAYHRIKDRFPDRFLLGVGIGHPEATSEYSKPYDTMVAYLDTLAAAGVPKDHLVLAALGPEVLRLSARRTAGAHPYLTTPRHTRLARDVLGEGPLLAPEQTVAMDSDPARARETARNFVARYLRMVNYRNSLLREGWTVEDLADGGSDQLVDELVLVGEPSTVANGVKSHLEAGANHVCIQDIGGDPLSGYQALAEALF
jgi:probable F420-dependent oxidoreductase